MSTQAWEAIPHEMVLAEPMRLIDKWVRLSNPESGVHVEGRCTDVQVSVGTDPILTLTHVDWPGPGRWQLKSPGSRPEFAVLCEVAAAHAEERQ